MTMPKDMQADVIKPIIHFIYTGSLDVDYKLLGKFWYIAKFINMPVFTDMLKALIEHVKKEKMQEQLVERVPLFKRVAVFKVTPPAKRMKIEIVSNQQFRAHWHSSSLMHPNSVSSITSTPNSNVPQLLLHSNSASTNASTSTLTGRNSVPQMLIHSNSASTNASTSTSDCRNYFPKILMISEVHNLLQNVQDKLQSVSNQVLTRLDFMENRIDSLEKRIAYHKPT